MKADDTWIKRREHRQEHQDVNIGQRLPEKSVNKSVFLNFGGRLKCVPFETDY